MKYVCPDYREGNHAKKKEDIEAECSGIPMREKSLLIKAQREINIWKTANILLIIKIIHIFTINSLIETFSFYFLIL